MEKLFLPVLNMSITASYVILFIILFRFLLKTVPKIFSYALWSVAFFRLICPFSFESAFSLLRVKAKMISSVEGIFGANANIIPGANVISDMGMVPGANMITDTIMYGQVSHPDNGIAAIDWVTNHPIPVPTVGASMSSIETWVTMGELVWLLGISFLLIYSIFTALRLQRKLKIADPVYGNIYEMRGIKTPFVFGIFKPKIYLPSGLTDNERTYIIRHEQTHIRRFDHIIKPLAFLVLCIHWFNPLAWIAFFLMGEDMELSCDERVIKELGSDIKKGYSSSLLALSTGRRIIGGCPLAFGESNTKGRIMNILNYKKPGFWIVAVSIIVVGAIGIGLLSNPPGEKMSEKDYAERFVQEHIANYKDAEWADFTNVDSEIITFERLDRFDDMLDSAVEIWHIEFRWKPGEIKESALGNVNFVDGWIVEDDSMGFKALVFSYEQPEPQFLGSIFSIDGLNGNGDTVAGRETLLRVYLEQHGLLPYETYTGDHVIVKFPLSTGETSQLLLSQPVAQGDSGIWCVERWMDGNGMVYYDIPATDGRIVEYYKSLQSECDDGNKSHLLDPVQVALEFINGKAGLGQKVSLDKLEIQYRATAKDFLQTPVSRYLGFISNFNTDEYSKPYFHLDLIEWLTVEDDERLKELNIDPNSLPNDYYIHNPVSYPAYFQAFEETEYNIIDFEGNANHKSISAEEFALYLNQFDEFTPPFHVVTKDGYVRSITEQYVP